MLLLLVLLCLSARPFPADTAPLTVTVTGIPAERGDVLVGVWKASENFLADETRIAGRVLPARAGSITCTFPDLPKGAYAISALHDADRNGRMSKSLLGWPVEAYGFSNNARGLFGAPSYTDCAFELRGATEVRIAVK